MNKKAMILIVGFVVVLLLSSNISFAEEEIVYDQIISNVVVSDETDYIISTNTIVSGIIEGNVIVNSGVYLKLDGIINGDLTLEPGSNFIFNGIVVQEVIDNGASTYENNGIIQHFVEELVTGE
ncbi:MAG: hypothetical protein BWY41_01925 [Candidatus Atribacteria bacterium ADurb.Bin276]|jgi:hypothetical protein|uniref:Polymer-forming cytoskeletal n=1 Tax=Candidatus Atribacter allofermentans TaxID=1852833 RepID=A0A1V5SK92_9BACT|nr:MAG: hypothetical protein BWY41_01925 [Candidatus Atribacteria bacterium ADurb.Bin276]